MICAREIIGSLTQARIQLMGTFGFLEAQQQYSAVNSHKDEGKLVSDLKRLEQTVRRLGAEVAQVRDEFCDLSHNGPTGPTG